MAIAAQPSSNDVDTVVGLMCQSIEHSHGKRWPDALACLDAGLLLSPAFFPCRLARARLLAEMARFDEALADMNYVLRRVQLPDAQAGFVAIFDAAMAHAQSRLAADRQDAAAYFQRGRVHVEARDLVTALADFERALALDASEPALHMARANVLCELDRFRDAIAGYECILALDPDNALAWYNRGNALQKHGLLSEAIGSYHHAVAIAPQFAEAQLELAHCLLAQGEFMQGWRQYEWRWQTAQLAPTQLPTIQQRWLGESGLSGKTILLWAEQGFGDTIQFARFVPHVAALAGHVVLRLPEPLRELMSTLDQRITVIGQAEPLPPHDVHCPLMSLPLALGAELPLVGGAYLHVDPARRQPQHGVAAKRRIGVCWAGRKAGAAGAYNPGRDIPPAALSALAALDAEFVSLQQDDTAAAPLPFLPLPQPLASFADTAALIATLDLVLSVDTAVAHLAGALGKPCWLLLRRVGEWRWQQQREDTPWYPSMRILRQQHEGDWDELLQRVAALI